MMEPSTQELNGGIGMPVFWRMEDNKVRKQCSWSNDVIFYGLTLTSALGAGVEDDSGALQTDSFAVVLQFYKLQVTFVVNRPYAK